MTPKLQILTLDDIKTLLIPNDWVAIPEKGFGNGYIGVPSNHPWYKEDYDYLNNFVNIHGGLTYADNHAPRNKPDNLWWIGFDTSHFNDTQETCPESYVKAEIESLKQQAYKAYLKANNIDAMMKLNIHL